MLGENYSGAPEGNRPLSYFGPDTIHGITIARVHEEALYDLIWNRRNTQAVTEDGEKIIESGPRTYVVRDITKDRFMDILPYSERFLKEYTKNLMTGYKKEVRFEYDYHDRLYNYEVPDADGDVYGEDQVYEMIHKLIKNQNSRRAVAITWKPEVDNFVKDCPCLQYIQFRIVDDMVNMYVLFRSNDILSAFGNNAYALTTLQMYVTDYISRSINRKLNYGLYMHTAVSPHIYYERDAAEFEKVMKYLHEEKLL